MERPRGSRARFSAARSPVLPLPKMGRSAYWKPGSDSLASAALGDANRGAFLALQSAVSTRRRLVATDPPSDGPLPFFELLFRRGPRATPTMASRLVQPVLFPAPR